MSLLHHYITSDRGEMASDGGSLRNHLRKYNINLDSSVPFGKFGFRFFNSTLQAEIFPAEPWFKESFSIFARVRYNDNTEQEMFSGTTGFNTISLRKTTSNGLEFGMGTNIIPGDYAWFADTANFVVATGRWHNIMCTYDKPNTTARIYVDTDLKREITDAVPPAYVLDTWRIGMDHEDLHPLHATTQEIIIWDEVIGPDAIEVIQKRGALEMDAEGVYLWYLDATATENFLERNGSLNISSEALEETLPLGVPLEASTQSWKTPRWREGFLDG